MRHRAGALALATAVLTGLLPAAAPAATPQGTYTDWTFPGSNFSNMDFRFQPLNDPSPAPYFWSHQFWLTGGDGGYTGLQTTAATRPDGSKGKIAIFSIWQSLGTQVAPGGSCNFFDNEGWGWSCRIAFDWVPDHVYRMRVARTGGDASGTWWTSSIVDLTGGGTERTVGSIKVPAAWGWLNSFTVTFTEYWDPIATCEELVLARMYFHTPKANDGTVVPGPAHNHLATTGDCPGSAMTVEPDGATHSMGTPDVTPPSPPGSLRVTGFSIDSIAVAWTASTDNWAIREYRIARGGTLIATTAATTYLDTGLDEGSSHTYTVIAVDQAGNGSAAAGPVTGTTGAAPPSEVWTDWTLPRGDNYNVDLKISPIVDPSPAPYAWGGRFWFDGGDAGFAGLYSSAATRPNGTAGKTAVFSVAGAIASTPASGGACVAAGGERTCRIAYEWQTGRQYRMRIWALSADASGETWGAWVMDLGSGAESFIGSIKVPAAWERLSGYVAAYTQYWGTLADCAQLVPVAALFPAPSANAGTVAPGAPRSLVRGTCPGGAASIQAGGVRHDAGVPDTMPPSAPSGLRPAGRTANTISLAWTPATDNWGIASYRVFRDGTMIASAAQAAYTDSVTAGSGYSYTVQAVDPAGNVSAASAPLEVAWNAPSAPQSVSATATAGPGTVIVSWQAPASPGSGPVTGYRVYRRDESGANVLLAALPAWQTSYADRATTVLTKYFYRVTAINPVEGAASPEACARAWLPIPALACAV